MSLDEMTSLIRAGEITAFIASFGDEKRLISSAKAGKTLPHEFVETFLHEQEALFALIQQNDRQVCIESVCHSTVTDTIKRCPKCKQARALTVSYTQFFVNQIVKAGQPAYTSPTMCISRAFSTSFHYL